MKRNVPIFGFIIGALLPVLGLGVIYLAKFTDVSFTYFLKTIMSDGKVAGKVFTLSILINLLPFIYYTNRRLDYTARGIFIATMIYVAFILLVMYVWN